VESNEVSRLQRRFRAGLQTSASRELLQSRPWSRKWVEYGGSGGWSPMEKSDGANLRSGVRW